MPGLSASSLSKSLYEEADECERIVPVYMYSQLLFRGRNTGRTHEECGVVVCEVWGFVDVWCGVLELELATESTWSIVFILDLEGLGISCCGPYFSSVLGCRIRSTSKFRF